MKIVGITILISGILFTLFTYFYVQKIPTPTTGWEPWIGLLVIVTGSSAMFKARNE